MAACVAKVVRQKIPIFQESDAAVRIGTHASAEKVVPPAERHVELIAIIASAFRVPHTLVHVRPPDFDRQRQDRVHRRVGVYLTHVTIVETLPSECTWRAAN